MTLSDRIQIRLKKLGKSERGASLEAGLSDSFLRNIREGKSSSPRIDTLEKIAEVLGTTTGWLISGEGREDVSMQISYDERPNAVIGENSRRVNSVFRYMARLLVVSTGSFR